MIGHDLHLAAIVGESNLRDSADELGIDISWIPETASKQLSAPPQSVSAKDANSSSTKVVSFYGCLSSSNPVLEPFSTNMKYPSVVEKIGLSLLATSYSVEILACHIG